MITANLMLQCPIPTTWYWQHKRKCTFQVALTSTRTLLEQVHFTIGSCLLIFTTCVIYSKCAIYEMAFNVRVSLAITPEEHQLVSFCAVECNILDEIDDAILWLFGACLHEKYILIVQWTNSTNSTPWMSRSRLQCRAGIHNMDCLTSCIIVQVVCASFYVYYHIQLSSDKMASVNTIISE